MDGANAALRLIAVGILRPRFKMVEIELDRDITGPRAAFPPHRSSRPNGKRGVTAARGRRLVVW